MICPGGCIGGPSKHQAEAVVIKARTELLGKADGRKILENLKQYPMDRFSMHRDGDMPKSYEETYRDGTAKHESWAD